MKLRNGFISNSSSSTFIVAFERMPISEADLMSMMYPDGQGYRGEFYESTKDAIVARVWRDLATAQILCEATILKELTEGYLPCTPRYDEFRNHTRDVDRAFHDEHPGKRIMDYPDWKAKSDEAWRLDWEDYARASDKATRKYWESIKEDFLNKAYVVALSYGDENGDGALEHGDIFANLTYVRVSHH